MRENSHVVRLRSLTGPGWHQVDLENQTCDCAGFQSSGRNCQHLNALGIYHLKPFAPRSHPSFSQALSALIKSIRLRRADDAVYWRVYSIHNASIYSFRCIPQGGGTTNKHLITWIMHSA